MIDPISINGTIEGINNNTLHKEDKEKDATFSKLLKENLQKVNQMQLQADQKTQDFALGKVDNIHDVMISNEKAQIALNLTLAIQNKVVDAYKEVMRMQV